MKNKWTITTSGVLLTIAFLFSCASVRISGTNVETIYSNVVEGEETGDCAGYTVRVTKIPSGRLEINFTAHEGSCSIGGVKAEEVRYLPEQDILSFSVPFLSSSGRAFYRFQGRMKNSYLEGELRVEYPSDPKYNEKEAVKLQKTEESQFPPMQ
jgi:hypothetical protein